MTDQSESVGTWLSAAETLVKSLDFIDPAHLPPSFSGDLLGPLRDGLVHVEELRDEIVFWAMINRLALIRSKANQRRWFFLEHVCSELAKYLRAEETVIYFATTEPDWVRVHPIEGEDDQDTQIPPGSQRDFVTIESTDWAQHLIFKSPVANQSSLAIRIRSRVKTPRILTTRLRVLAKFAELLFAVIEPYLGAGVEMENAVVITGADKLRDDDEIIGSDPRFVEAIQKLERAADSEASVYIRGESGTGKELFARRLHRISPRGNGPFVAINTSAIPHELIESEMFGHEKGAFTGAYYRKIGRVEQAHGGTLFLDEIGEMPLAFQAKLLRYLQEKQFTRVGGNQTVSSDARVVVATHRDLKEMVSEKTFREDLYYRIHVIPIDIPPLRERGMDVRLIANILFEKYIHKSRASRRTVEEAVFEALQMYEFKGNVRELDNIIQRTVVMAKGNKIRLRDLPDEVKQAVGPSQLGFYQLHPFEKYDVVVPSDRETLRQLKHDVEQVSVSYGRDLERRFLMELLRRADGSARKAAELADINRTLFYKLMKRAGIDITAVAKDES